MTDHAFSASRRLPVPANEPVRSYAPGTPERLRIETQLTATASERVEIPLVIGGRRVKSGTTRAVVMPCDHQHVLADCHLAEPRHVAQAIEAAVAAQREWAAWPWEDRLAVFLKAADLLATTWRDRLNAATMLGQGKTVYQAEIDAACELIDFWRFNAHFAAELYAEQPISSAGTWNQMDHRPLEGVVYAVTPFNFTAIAGNLSSANVLVGGATIWKPASSALLSAHLLMALYEEAGLPPGLINFVPGDPVAITDKVLASRDLAGVHFTGSTGVFQSIWQAIGANIANYRSYPRVVGETGGKDFIAVHPSADPQAVAVAIVRGGFEYQGQKCSAASRIYVPRSLWPDVRDRVVAMMQDLQMGDVRDFRNFVAAVIDRPAFNRIRGSIRHAQRTARIIHGGGTSDRTGFFIEPTLVQTTDPGHKLMREEIFGPVVTAYVYPDRQWSATLDLIDTTSPYALTGAVFARDRAAVAEASTRLRNAAGNFYINDKPTGAVVGQQPFGGARASGTNDKAGSKLNLMRWLSPRVVKETFVPPVDYTYPFMKTE
ncbi:MAG: 1-pyrroline-5-carboxylate dehydrogenase [Acidobacteria bacterium SCN 69-37]|nr:MAG: 1-pyrroline-5-carboxylate dehydrogenase [Acidobacteria bacterium SCN 69-37]